MSRNQPMWAFVCLIGGLTAMSACGRLCKQAQKEVIQPVEVVRAYLMTDPRGEDLAKTGCAMIVGQFDKIPEGAETIRKIAESRFSHTTSLCLEYRNAYRYRCSSRYPFYKDLEGGDFLKDLELINIADAAELDDFSNESLTDDVMTDPPRRRRLPRTRPHSGRRVCRHVPYMYCARWQYDTQRDPQYAQAIRLSQSLDAMFAYSQQMCRDAQAGHFPAAYQASRDLLKQVDASVKPDGEAVYRAACRHK